MQAPRASSESVADLIAAIHQTHPYFAAQIKNKYGQHLHHAMTAQAFPFELYHIWRIPRPWIRAWLQTSHLAQLEGELHAVSFKGTLYILRRRRGDRSRGGRGAARPPSPPASDLVPPPPSPCCKQLDLQGCMALSPFALRAQEINDLTIVCRCLSE